MAGEQGSVALAKADTVFYGVTTTPAMSELATDLCQLLDNMTAGAGNWIYQTSSKFNVHTGPGGVAVPFAFEFDGDYQTADTGYLWHTYSGNMSVALGAGGVLTLVVRGSTVGTVTSPGISGTPGRYIVSCSSEENVDTTGASDLVRYELRVLDYGTGAFAKLVHYDDRLVSAGGSILTIFGASSTGGANPYTGLWRSVRFSAGRFHTHTETREDFVSRTPVVTLTQTTSVTGTPSSRLDTVFLGDTDAGLMSEMAVDIGPQLDDMVAGAGNWVEENSARWNFNIGPGGTMVEFADEFLIDIDNTDTGYLLRYKSELHTLVLSAGGSFRWSPHGAPSLDYILAAPSISGTRQTYLVTITTLDEWPPPYAFPHFGPFRFELRIRNVLTGELAVTSTGGTGAEHQPGSPASGDQWMLFGARDTLGTSPFTGVWHSVRHSVGSYHSDAISVADFLTTNIPADVGIVKTREFPLPDRASTIGDDGNFSGPVYAMVAAATRENSMRLVSPLINRVYRQSYWMDSDIPSNVSGPAPDGSGYITIARYASWAIIPNTVNRLKIRMYVQTYPVVASTPHTLNLRFYVTSRRPNSSDLDFVATNVVQVSADHGSGDSGGEWVDFSITRIIKSNVMGGAYITPAFMVVDGGGGQPLNNQDFRIKAITVDGARTTDSSIAPVFV